MQILQMGENKRPLLLMSSHSSEEWVGNVQSTKRNPCIMEDSRP